MKKIVYAAMAACAMACTPKITENTDMVAEILSGNGKLDLSAMQWTREPQSFNVNGDTIEIVTAPGTDLWQRTYYHFRNDNAPVLQMEIAKAIERDRPRRETNTHER